MEEEEAPAVASSSVRSQPQYSVGTRCELLSSTSSTGLRASIKRYGEIAYIGSVEGLPAGEWIGVKLDKPLGKNDGTINNHRYFDCKPLHGAFARREKVNTMGEFPILNTQAESLAHALEERRKAIVDKKQHDKQERASSYEQSADDLVQTFWKRFIAAEDEIRRQMERFVEQKQQPVPCDLSKEIQLDELVLQVGKMREEAATAASLYLSPYDIRQTQMIITKLLDLIETTRITFAPRKKFTFKARTKKIAAKDEIDTGKKGAAETPETEPTAENNKSGGNQSPKAAAGVEGEFNELVYANLHNRVIVIDNKSFADDDPNKRRDLNFSRLTNCAILVCVETSAIRGNALKNCVIYTGAVWGSIWLEDCVSCDFFVACRQLRVHHSSATNFHLRISSHPIIEDCHQMKFGPYRLQFDGLTEQLERIGLFKDTGLWAKVNDFKWHRAQQSPHWSVWDPKQPPRTIADGLKHLVSYE